VSKSKSSVRWLARQSSDPYVRKAQAQGFSSRAAFKLEEIQSRDHLIRPGMTVVDLGAAPGGWTQVAAGLVGSKGKVIALDLLPIEAPVGVHTIQGDFREPEIYAELLQILKGRSVDLVLSDMAPNWTGITSVDQPHAMALAELAEEFSMQVLATDGSFLVKVFQGEGLDLFRAQLKLHFSELKTRKPPASRSESREIYLLAQKKIPL